MTQENTNNNVVDTQEENTGAANNFWQKTKDTANRAANLMNNEERKEKREAKKAEKKTKKEAKSLEREINKEKQLRQLSESNSDMEALTVLVGTGMAKFFVYALVGFMVCLGLYLLVESIYVFTFLILSLISLFK